jgi:hypothetical protein
MRSEAQLLKRWAFTRAIWNLFGRQQNKETKMSTDDYVWIAAKDPLHLRYTWAISDVFEKSKKLFEEAYKLNGHGCPVPPEHCPQRIWGRPGEMEYNDGDLLLQGPLPSVFNVTGYVIVSASFAKILNFFDLGQGGVYPVSQGVYLGDNKTRVPGEFFTWIFGNHKVVFVPEATTNLRPWANINPVTTWKLPFDLKDDEIAVSTKAHEGPNVWMEPDNRMVRGVFLSKALGNALTEAGLTTDFPICRCRVV